MSEKKSFEYPGTSATVTWDGALCIHIGECGRADGELFVGGRKPWCDPNLASDDETKEVVERCPTGALSARFRDGSREETADPENTVHVAYNGPLFVRGALDIEGAPEDVPGLRFRAALCRCGASKNKPYCDNSHLDAGFRDYGAVGKATDRDPDRGGTLSIKAIKDGPLMLMGNVSVIASGAKAAWRGNRVALCRCGASGNKPFCDGQHKEVGFTSD